MDRHCDPLAALEVVEGSNQEQVEQARASLGVKDNDLVLGQYKVWLLIMPYVLF